MTETPGTKENQGFTVKAVNPFSFFRPRKRNQFFFLRAISPDFIARRRTTICNYYRNFTVPKSDGFSVLTNLWL